MTVSVAALRTPNTHALIDTDVFADVADVRIEKVAVVAPAGMVTLDAIGAATAALPDVSVTTIAPGAAGHSSAIVPVTVAPPRTGFGDSVNACARIGRTPSASVCVTPPKLAVTLPLAGVVTAAVGTANVVLVAPAGTVTLEGTVAFALVFVSGTSAPPAGAGPFSNMRPEEDRHPPMTVVGVR